MLNVLICEDDRFYRQGVMELLKDLVRKELGRDLYFTFGFSGENVAAADLIILNLCQGEQYICLKPLRQRRKGAIVGIVESGFKRQTRMPFCLQNIHLIERGSEITLFRQQLRIAFNESEESIQPACNRCNHKIWSHQQKRIMHALYVGHSTAQIAEKLQLNEKTIFAHKYQFMNKFSLNGTYELHRFLSRVNSGKQNDHACKVSHPTSRDPGPG